MNLQNTPFYDKLYLFSFYYTFREIKKIELKGVQKN